MTKMPKLAAASRSSVIRNPHRSSAAPTSGAVTANAARKPKLASELAVARNSLPTRRFKASRRITAPNPRQTKKIEHKAMPATTPRNPMAK